MTEDARPRGVSPDQSPQTRVFNFRQLDLRPNGRFTWLVGDTVSGMGTLPELDEFVDQVTQDQTGRKLSSGSTDGRSSQITRLSDSVRQDGRRIGCYGPVRNFVAEVLSFEKGRLVMQFNGQVSSVKREDVCTVCRVATIWTKANGDPGMKSTLIKEDQTRREVREKLDTTPLAAVRAI